MLLLIFFLIRLMGNITKCDFKLNLYYYIIHIYIYNYIIFIICII